MADIDCATCGRPLPEYAWECPDDGGDPVHKRPPTITCPVCHRTSHNPNDVREGYCGACHDWTTPR